MTTPPDHPYGIPDGTASPAQPYAPPSVQPYAPQGGPGQTPPYTASGTVVPYPQPAPSHQAPYPGFQQPGYPQQGYPQQGYPQPGYPQPGYPQPVVSTGSLYKAAAIVNWVTLGIVVVATMGFGLIAAAWMIPMTVRTQKVASDGYKHTALAVCNLLFCNTISGILMLVDDSNRRDY